jgi:hypothetical protein
MLMTVNITRKAYSDVKIRPEDIYNINMDEKGFMIGQARKVKIVRKGIRNPR